MLAVMLQHIFELPCSKLSFGEASFDFVRTSLPDTAGYESAFPDVVSGSAQVHELVHAQELLSNLQLRANAALQQQLKHVSQSNVQQ